MEPDVEGGLNIEEASAGIAADLGFGTESDETDSSDVSHETTETGMPAASAEQAAAPAEVDAPPQSWAKDKHHVWAKLDPEARAYYRTREDQMLTGLNQYKENNEFGKKIKEIASPYSQYLASQNVTPEKAFEYLISAQYRLANSDQNTKIDMLKQLAQSVGVDFGKINAQTASNPDLDPIRAEINAVKSQLEARNQAEFNQKAVKVSQDVNAFASDPAHPYFDEVAEEVTGFIRNGADLAQAYEKAVWANPVTRAKEIARVQTEHEQKLKAKSKEEVQKAARSTSTNVRSRDTGKAPTEPLGSWDDTMKETLTKIRAGTH